MLMEDYLISVVLLLDTNFSKNINCYKHKFFLACTGGKKRCLQNFGGETLKEKTTLKTQA